VEDVLPYDMDAVDGLARLESFTIFEGTSEIQHLVIARAISGIHNQ
jgi:alkylation response protein AidB-like acyl-CoA dehydrogenase